MNVREGHQRSADHCQPNVGGYIAKTHVVYQRDTFDVHMLSVKCVLQQLYDIVAYSMLGSEAFGPCEDFPRVQRSLLNGEGEGQSERKDVWRISG